jgi:hypothetical protein
MPLVISTKGLPLKNPISVLVSSDSLSVNGVVSLEQIGSKPQSSRGVSNRLGKVSTLMSRDLL